MTEQLEQVVQSRLATFRRELRMARAAAKMSQTELARRVNKSQEWVSSIERGRIEPSWSDVIAISEVLKPMYGKNLSEVFSHD